jgi:hypothetical protein
MDSAPHSVTSQIKPSDQFEKDFWHDVGFPEEAHWWERGISSWPEQHKKDEERSRGRPDAANSARPGAAAAALWPATTT